MTGNKVSIRNKKANIELINIFNCAWINHNNTFSFSTKTSILRGNLVLATQKQIGITYALFFNG